MDRGERRAELERALDGVPGYFSTDEAWALYDATVACSGAHRARVVEIGSYKGRSTIAISFALLDGNGGSVVSIDPHAPTGKVSYFREHGSDDTFEEYVANVQRAGVYGFVQPMRETSVDARSHYDGVPIDLLFVDGSHDYDDVVYDIDAWLPLVNDRATLAFNDPYAADVNRALRERLFAPGFGLRSPYHVNNTLFVGYVRHARTDAATAWKLRAYLFVERVRFRLVKLTLKGVFERLGIVYVAERRFRSPDWSGGSAS